VGRRIDKLNAHGQGGYRFAGESNATSWSAGGGNDSIAECDEADGSWRGHYGKKQPRDENTRSIVDALRTRTSRQSRTPGTNPQRRKSYEVIWPSCSAQRATR